MFNSGHFAPDYFGEHFKPIKGEVYVPPGGGGGFWVNVDQTDLKAFKLKQEDEEILEFVVAFVLSRGL